MKREPLLWQDATTCSGGKNAMHSKLNAIFVGIVVCITMVFAVGLVPGMAHAAPQELDIDQGDIIITTTGYSVGGAPETSYSGPYRIINQGVSPSGNTITVQSGDHAISLTNISIDTASVGKDASPFAIDAGASVSLVPSGTNRFIAYAGRAGIFVAPELDDGSKADAILVIEEDSSAPGTIDAVGGDGSSIIGGGAGIGGNGSVHNGGSSPLYPRGNFGDVTIKDSSVTAQGGSAQSVDVGAGAGIGGGGECLDSGSFVLDAEGSVTISGGDVKAIGGMGTSASNDSYGAAGIGSGGMEQSYSKIAILISEGSVEARGGSDAAGIGGGANAFSHATIAISGGTVNAIGGDEGDGSSYGGAGIGGGDNASASAVVIKGTATVTAKGGGAAAGIGGGKGGTIATVTISEQARVVASGGSTSSRGGAGIGMGRDNYQACPGSGVVTISDQAYVVAYGGLHAQAIGAGSQHKTSLDAPGASVLNVDDTITLFLFNTLDQAVLGQSPVNVEDRPAYPLEGSAASKVVAFTVADSSNPALFPSTSTRMSATAKNTYEWHYSGSVGSYDLAIYEGASITPEVQFTSTLQTFGNWATLIPVAPAAMEYSVIYNANGGTGSPYTVTETVGQSHIVLPDGDANLQYSRTGYTFLGWSENFSATIAQYAPGASIGATAVDGQTITLYAIWEPIPPVPICTVTYDPNGGTGAPYSVTVSQGASHITLGSADVNLDYSYDGKKFIGWNTKADGTGISYAPGDTIVVNNNVELYAQWEALPDDDDGKDDDKGKGGSDDKGSGGDGSGGSDKNGPSKEIFYLSRTGDQSPVKLLLLMVTALSVLGSTAFIRKRRSLK